MGYKEEIDFDSLRLPDSFWESLAPSPEKPPHQKNHFIKGPIPLAWFDAAEDVSYVAGCIGARLWYRSGIEKSKIFRLKAEDVEHYSRWSLYRALDGLQKAGLILYQRKRGARPVVTILGVG